MLTASLTAGLAPLAFLACPVGMGLMMWMMFRGNKRQDQPQVQSRTDQPQPASLEVLREEQQRLSEEIDRLEGTPQGATRESRDSR